MAKFRENLEVLEGEDPNINAIMKIENGLFFQKTLTEELFREIIREDTTGPLEEDLDKKNRDELIEILARKIFYGNLKREFRLKGTEQGLESAKAARMGKVVGKRRHWANKRIKGIIKGTGRKKGA